MAAHNSNATRPNAICLPFNPGPEFKALQEKYGQPDRYLFRLSDKHSRASTNTAWVKSRDAQRLEPNSNRDIFARYPRSDAAEALRRHLNNEVGPQGDDNFVSWSSSLLWVLQHACWTSRLAGRNATDTFICVVDTTRLPARAFISDMFLISAFSQHDASAGRPSVSMRSLPGMQSLRQKKHPEYDGSYYYGEYLSQGALRVEVHCSISPLAGILDAGLYTLRQELSIPTPKGEGLNVSVIKLREKFYDASPCCAAEAFEIESALRIGDKYGPSWKVPIALAFLALKPRPDWDDGIMEAFRQFHGKSRLSESWKRAVFDDMQQKVK
jgi:hypothetical protein